MINGLQTTIPWYYYRANGISFTSMQGSLINTSCYQLYNSDAFSFYFHSCFDKIKVKCQLCFNQERAFFWFANNLTNSCQGFFWKGHVLQKQANGDCQILNLSFLKYHKVSYNVMFCKRKVMPNTYSSSRVVKWLHDCRQSI